MILQIANDQDNRLLNNTRRQNPARPGISQCPDSLARWYCLNGATCFSVAVEDSVLYNCWCQNGFHGARCDYKYTSGALGGSSSLGHNSSATDRRREPPGASSDRMAALGLVSLGANAPTSGQTDLAPINEPSRPTIVLALVCCLILMLVIALLIQRFLKIPDNRECCALFKRSTMGWTKSDNRQAERKVVVARQPLTRVDRKCNDTREDHQSDYVCAHAIARQATLAMDDWQHRPAVAATAANRQTNATFVEQQPLVLMRAHKPLQQVARGRVIDWPPAGHARGSSSEAAQV